MSIDVNGISSSQIPSKVTAHEDTKVKPQEQLSTSSGKSSTADTLSLSNSAKQLGGLSNAAQNTPVVDAKRVEAMRQAISSGEYEVDPVKVASKLMQFESMLKSGS